MSDVMHLVLSSSGGCGFYASCPDICIVIHLHDWRMQALAERGICMHW